jgi:hypothetical protein
MLSRKFRRGDAQTMWAAGAAAQAEARPLLPGRAAATDDSSPLPPDVPRHPTSRVHSDDVGVARALARVIQRHP